MKNLFVLFSLLFCFAMIGCIPANLPSTVEVPIDQTNFPDPFPNPTTVTPSSVTQPAIMSARESQAKFTATPSDFIGPKLINKCLKILPAVPEKAGLYGHAYLEMYSIPGKKLIGSDALLVLGTNQLILRTAPQNTQFGSYKTSPDGKSLAYWKIVYGADKRQIARSIIIENYYGKVLKELPGDLNNWDTFYWLDNERIVIGEYGQPLVINPFTGESFDLSKWYAQSPGGLKTIPVWQVNGLFDSQLTRLFYLQEDYTMLLWDLESHKILASLVPASSHKTRVQPKWSWDFSQIVLAYSPIDAPKNSDEFFSVNRDGQVRQLTNLGRYFSEVRISKFSWSPDGRKIAFFFSDPSQSDKSSHFGILYMETLDIIEYCNLSGSMYTLSDVEPVWSPDGTKILIGRLESDETTLSTILLDISGEYVAQIAQDLVPAGWMKEP